MDLDDLLEVVESVGLARLVYEKIIITDIELAAGVVALQLCHIEPPYLAFHVAVMDVISFAGHRQHYGGASCTLSLSPLMHCYWGWRLSNCTIVEAPIRATRMEDFLHRSCHHGGGAAVQ
ncbi:hypothetical protein IEQ34_016712 [Dendrobium chrysotoxum]|uniref:Uncharacterized protein n=1 Tax=Dendrobium chrysotoxum TaxID=161865 RepID=A0AAV7GHA1_DENCH|nr:hypothetical protein IEQ34_016712 [Dendrobium chrysotoxum]